MKEREHSLLYVTFSKFVAWISVVIIINNNNNNNNNKLCFSRVALDSIKYRWTTVRVKLSLWTVQQQCDWLFPFPLRKQRGYYIRTITETGHPIRESSEIEKMISVLVRHCLILLRNAGKKALCDKTKMRLQRRLYNDTCLYLFRGWLHVSVKQIASLKLINN